MTKYTYEEIIPEKTIKKFMWILRKYHEPLIISCKLLKNKKQIAVLTNWRKHQVEFMVNLLNKVLKE